MKTTNGLPPLKIAQSKKNKDWVTQVVAFADKNNSMYHSSGVRATVQDAIIDVDLYNGILHVPDFVKLLNPMDLKTIDKTRELKHYAIAAPLIDLLVGEEIKSPFDPHIHITNNIAIEEKEARVKLAVQEFVDETVASFEGTEDELKDYLSKYQRYLKYTYKDLKEKKATALYVDAWDKLDLEAKFIEGYRNALLTSEEIYIVDIIRGETTFTVGDRLHVQHWGASNTSRIEDSDIITYEDHVTPGSIIDTYGDQLSNDEVEQITNLNVGFGGHSFDKPYGDVTHEFIHNDEFRPGSIMGDPLSSSFTDSQGNIRVLKVRFKAYKEIKKVAYQDEATGEQQVKVVDARYRLTPNEKVLEKEWIVEWWKAVKIGADIIVDYKPNAIRYNRLSSPTEGHPGIVGEVYNINDRRAVSAMSRMRSFQYLYDIIMDRLIVAMSKNIGPILEMDLAKKPVDWNTKKWLDYIYKYNTKFVDNFKEINKGSAQGQLAGNLAAGRDQQLSLDFGNYIQQLINMAEYIKVATGDIIGITPQRKGAVSNRETVGGIERATSQSSHITEWYRFKHENVKLRAISVLLEAAKTALKDNPKKLNTILEPGVVKALDVQEEDFVDIDLGIFVSNANKVKEHKQIMEQSAQALMQNGGSFSFVYDVLFSDSMAEKRRLIEEHEMEQKMEQAEASKAEQKQFTEQIEANKADKDKERSLEKYKADLKAKVDLKSKQIDLLIAQGKLESVAISDSKSLEADILKLDTQMREGYEDRKVKREDIKATQEAKTAAQGKSSPTV